MNGATLIWQRHPDGNYLDVGSLIIMEHDRCPKQFARKLPVSSCVWLSAADKDNPSGRVLSNNQRFCFQLGRTVSDERAVSETMLADCFNIYLNIIVQTRNV